MPSGPSQPQIYDLTDHGLQQGTFLLNVVQEVAKYAPIPYLQEAAGSVLFLFNTVAATKNNKEDLKRLAGDAINLIATIWASYQFSENKDLWPPRNLREVILSFLREMDSINDFVKARVSKPWGIRAVYNVFDAKKIIEYRQRLNSAVQNFQISSDLNVNEMLLQLAKKQDEVLKHVQMPAPTPQYAPLPAPLPARPHPEYHSGRPAPTPMYGTAEPTSPIPRPTRPQVEYPAHPSGAHGPSYSPMETASTSHEAVSAYFDMPFPEGRQDAPAPRKSWPQPYSMGLRPQAEYSPYTDSSPRIPTYSPARPVRANYQAASAYDDTRPPMAEWQDLPLVRQSGPSPSSVSFNNVNGSGIAFGGGPVNVVNK